MDCLAAAGSAGEPAGACCQGNATCWAAVGATAGWAAVGATAACAGEPAGCAGEPAGSFLPKQKQLNDSKKVAGFVTCRDLALNIVVMSVTGLKAPATQTCHTQELDASGLR